MKGYPVISQHGDATLQLGSGSAVALKRSSLPATINIARYTEDLTWLYHFAGPQGVKTGLTKKAFVDNKLITLSQFTTAAPGGSGYLETRYTEGSVTPFKVGGKYLVSLYVYSDKDFWWLWRLVTSINNGHGHVWIRAGEITRVWYVAVATSTSKLDVNVNPTTVLGQGTPASVGMIWHTFGPNLDVYVGGFQIEPIPDSYRDGIALIGDSTMAGASGKLDYSKDFTKPDNREVSTVLGSELCVPVYNRAVGGERLDQMNDRWATDITPLASRCHTAIIQGGINDVEQGRSLDAMKTSVLAMRDKAVADGFSDVRALTITPYLGTNGNAVKNTKRLAHNAWLKETFGDLCCDIAPIVTGESGDALNSGTAGDGTHYTGPAKTAIGIYVASSMDWSWRIQPAEYLRVTA